MNGMSNLAKSSNSSRERHAALLDDEDGNPAQTGNGRQGSQQRCC